MEEGKQALAAKITSGVGILAGLGVAIRQLVTKTPATDGRPCRDAWLVVSWDRQPGCFCPTRR